MISRTAELDRALDLAERASGTLSELRRRFDIDRVETVYSGTVEAADLDALSELVESGGTAQLKIGRSEWTLFVSLSGGNPAVITQEGDAALVVEEHEAGEITRAIERQDLETIFEFVHALDLELTLVVKNDPEISGFHWIRSTALLNDALRSEAWATTVRRLTAKSSEMIVADAHDAVVEFEGVRVAGPMSSRTGRGHTPPTVLSAGGRPPLPTPLAFRPNSAGIEDIHLSSTAKLLNGVGRHLCWYHLAQKVTVEEPGGSITLTFAGVRVVELRSVRLSPLETAEDDFSLFEWAYAPDDPARQEAVQQAASLAIPGQGDVDGCAVPVLRTARSIYETALRGAVAEALATRRAARQAAFTAANDAGKAARDASSKIVDRTAVQLAAAAGAIVANSKDLLSTPVTALVLFVLSVVSFGSWRVSSRVDVGSAEGALVAVSSDLGEYRESLSEEDIEAIRNMRTVSQATDVLSKAKETSQRVAYGASAVFLVAGILVAVFVKDAEPAKAPTAPTPSPNPTLSTTVPIPPLRGGPSSPTPVPPSRLDSPPASSATRIG